MCALCTVHMHTYACMVDSFRYRSSMVSVFIAIMFKHLSIGLNAIQAMARALIHTCEHTLTRTRCDKDRDANQTAYTHATYIHAYAE